MPEHEDTREPDLTAKQVAAELQVNALTVQRYLRDGRLNGYRIGRLWRVPRAALDAFKAQGADLTPGRPRKVVGDILKRPVGRPRKAGSEPGTEEKAQPNDEE